MLSYSQISELLGSQADSLLNHTCRKISKHQIVQPSEAHVDQVFTSSDRSHTVINNLKKLYAHGRLAHTGYLSILPVDQGIEHTAAASFYKNPSFFDPERIVKLAIEGGCSGVASSAGILGLVAKKYSKHIPFIVKLNHNELLTYPTKHDQHMFASVEQAHSMGAVGIGATIYFGSQHSNRQIEEVSAAFELAHEMGLFTILWCYPRNEDFKKDGENYEQAADITAQACYLGANIEADIVKQKLPASTDGFRQIGFSKYDQEMYQQLLTDHPIDLVRYQVAHCFMGKIDLLNSGGASGDDDLKQAVTSAVINKRGGGSGLIMGRKAFSKPFEEGVRILNAVQDVYLNEAITVA